MRISMIALVFAALMPLSLIAGTTTSTVGRILLYEERMLIYVYPEGGLTNPPPCHGTNGEYYSFSANRPMAKEYLSLLIAAQATNATVTFWGADACNDQSVSETLRYFRIGN